MNAKRPLHPLASVVTMLLLLVLQMTQMTASASAQGNDPMRPAGYQSAVSAIESGVQTVIIRDGGKSAAVINGEYVALGGKVGDKKVTAITESAVTLHGAGGSEVLKVMSAIDKVPVKSPNKAAKISRDKGQQHGGAQRTKTHWTERPERIPDK